MTTLHLVRHGQARAGTDNYDRLSALGQEQANHLGQWWKQVAHRSHACFSGDLQRQQHTASLANEAAQLDVDHQILPELNEYNHHHIDTHFGDGAQSDQPDSLTFQDYLATMDRWRQAGDAVPDGVESFQQFSTRGLEAVHTAIKSLEPGQHANLFTSGGVIASIVGQLLELPFHRVIESIWHIRNSSVTTLKVHDGHIILIDYNTIAHLPVESNPDLITLI